MILVVNRSKKLSKSICEIFYYMGLLSYPATPSEAFIEMSSLYRAVLVVEPNSLPAPEDFVCELRKYAEHVPVFSMSEKGPKDELAHLFDMSFKTAISSAIFASKVAKYSKSHGLPHIGHYMLAGFVANPDLPYISYFGKPVPLTKTKAMIFRYLIRSYPIPQTPKIIIKYAFRPSRHPDPSCIKTHISVINKIFEELEGRKLITLIPSKGYIVYTPEVKEILNPKVKVQAE